MDKLIASIKRMKDSLLFLIQVVHYCKKIYTKRIESEGGKKDKILLRKRKDTSLQALVLH